MGRHRDARPGHHRDARPRPRRHRHARPKRHSSTLIALIAFPLTIGTTSSYLVAPAGEVGPGVTSRAIVPDDLQATTPRLDTAPAVVVTSGSAAAGRVGLIPWTALQAYRRAAGILAEVSPECGLPWTLLAAMGQVESDHGQADGRELGDDAAVQPALRGPALDGRSGRAKVPDTDRGALDGDTSWDRELGPMRLAPSLWELAGVDGDGDGTRQVQDLDDAALATAVYLCAGGAGLHRPANAAAALLEYRRDEAYVSRVMEVEARFRQGRFTVSATPPMSSLSTSLGLGAGPVRDLTALAVADTAFQLGGPDGIPLPERDARTGDQVVTAGRPPRTSSPEAAVPGTPSASSTTSGPGQGISEEPTVPQPSSPGLPSTPGDPSASGLPTGDADETGAGEASEDPVGEPAPGPTDGPPTGTPTDGPSTDVPTTGATPTDGPSTGAPLMDAPSTDAPATDLPPTGGRPSGDPTGEGPLPSADPTTALVEGVWTACARGEVAVGGYCLDDALVDFALAGPLDAPAAEDLDGDGTVATVGEELEGLLGRVVRLTVVRGSRPLQVLAVSRGPMSPR